MRKAVDKVQLINKLTYYMQYPFVRYALIVGVLIACLLYTSDAADD